MQQNKPVILLYWGYHRKAWIQPFEELKANYRFVYFFKYSPEFDEGIETDCEIIYFHEYPSAQKLLNELKPQLVIFFGLNGLFSIALNVAAKTRGVKTVLMQHGFLYSYEDQIEEQRQEKSSGEQTTLTVHPQANRLRLHNVKFILRSLGLHNLDLFFRYHWNRYSGRVLTEHEQLQKLNDSRRLADSYWLYAPYFSDLFVKRDHVRPEQIKFFLNPELKEIKNLHDTSSFSEGDYYYLIDQPTFHSYKANIPPKYSRAEATSFYTKLARWTERRGARLRVKVHPYSFTYVGQYPKHNNVEYVLESSEMLGDILRAKGVFGFYSTLVLSALPYKKVCLFRLTEKASFYDFVEKNNLAKVYPFDFDIDKVDFEDNDFAAGNKVIEIITGGNQLVEFNDLLQMKVKGNQVG